MSQMRLLLLPYQARTADLFLFFWEGVYLTGHGHWAVCKGTHLQGRAIEQRQAESDMESGHAMRDVLAVSTSLIPDLHSRSSCEIGEARTHIELSGKKRERRPVRVAHCFSLESQLICVPLLFLSIRCQFLPRYSSPSSGCH